MYQIQKESFNYYRLVWDLHTASRTFNYFSFHLSIFWLGSVDWKFVQILWCALVHKYHQSGSAVVETDVVLRHLFSVKRLTPILHRNTNNSIWAARLAPWLPPVHRELWSMRQNTTQMGKANFKVMKIPLAGCIVLPRKQGLTVEAICRHW